MRRGAFSLAMAAAWLAGWLGFAGAVEPDEMLDDPALEARARQISQDLRCLVCQNQTIDDSAASLARDLRILIRERLREGDSDEEVMAFVVERYGDYVLLKPPVKGATLALWLAPLVFFLGGGIVMAWYFRTTSKRAGRGKIAQKPKGKAQP